MIHAEQHPLSGQSVPIVSGILAGNEYRIEDWWDRIAGQSWMTCDGNPACLEYAWRSTDRPIDNEVVYGKIDGLGYLVHVSEIAGGQK